MITIKQSKRLKELGFDGSECKEWWVETLEHSIDIPRSGITNFPSIPLRILSFKPSEDYHIVHCKAPNREQVIEWLKTEHGIWIVVEPDCYGELWYVKLLVCSRKVWDDIDRRHDILVAHTRFNNECKSSDDAYSVVFDYILDNLLN
jgi:hypothetical protein